MPLASSSDAAMAARAPDWQCTTIARPRGSSSSRPSSSPSGMLTAPGRCPALHYDRLRTSITDTRSAATAFASSGSAMPGIVWSGPSTACHSASTSVPA
jgi:hypothetical protein